MFPSGLRALTRTLDAPLVMHMGEWVGFTATSGAPPYSTNTSCHWVVEPKASLPAAGDDGGFWDWLFGSMAANGLFVYKLDHSQEQMPDMNYTLQNVGVTETWLRSMAEAAQKHGVNKQYGGHISSGFLHSLRLHNAHVARVSNDYIPGLRRLANACTVGADPHTTSPSGNVLLGKDSLYPWALGIFPYKDAFFSGPQHWANTTCFMSARGPESSGYTKPEWWGVQETFPELHALVSALTAGPVASGDGIGDMNAVLLRRTCRMDGVLLKPDRPAFVIDAWWQQHAFGRGGPKGEVTQTSTTIGDMTWRYVLGAALTSDYDVDALDLGLSSAEAGVAWRRQYGDAFAMPRAGDMVLFNRSSPLLLSIHPMADDKWGWYTFWRTAPINCAGRGWALLGEVDKFVSVSAQRFNAVKARCGGTALALEIDINGAPGENVSLAFRTPVGKLKRLM